MSSKKENRTQILVIAAVVALLIAVVAFFQSKREDGPKAPVPAVAVENADKSAAASTGASTGSAGDTAGKSPVAAEGAVQEESVAAAARRQGFTVVDGAYREFDGSPALAIAFSEPLDPKKDYGNFVQVLEMKSLDSTTRPSSGNEEEEEEGVQVVETSTKRGAAISLNGGTPVSGAWVHGENPRLMFFQHVKPNTRYIVRVQPGLTAADGRKLREEERFSIQTASVAPAYYFASRGTVLPVAQNGGLPVVTVNVPEVDIQFLKVKSDQLPEFLGKVIPSSRPRKARSPDDENEGDDDHGDDEYGNHSEMRLKGMAGSWALERIRTMTESVFLGRFVTEQKANRRSVTFIPVETVPALREPGVYVAVMSQPNRFSYGSQVTYFYVSDLGLHVRQYANRNSNVFVSSLTSGKGVSGVEVSWLSGDARALAWAETDSDGHASFDERPKGARVVVAKKGDQISLVTLKEPALDLAEFDIGGHPSSPVRLFAWSGRDLYRPGESFDLSVLARDADGRAAPAQPIQAIFRRPDGKKQWTESWQPDEAFDGYYRRKIELPVDAPTGFWNLELRSDPAAKFASTVMRIGVEEFLPERMKLDLASDLQALGAGDESNSWNIDVTGTYLYGAPAGGNRLLGAVNIDRSRNPLAKKLPGFVFGDSNEDNVRIYAELDEKKLDSKGKTPVDVDISGVRKRLSPFSVRATLSLLESGGRPVIRTIERVWWPAPVLVGVRPLFDGDYARENSVAEFDVARSDVAGNLKAGHALPVRLFRENRDYYWRFDDSRGWHSGFTETDELMLVTQVDIPSGGRGKLALPVKYGRYRVEVLDPDTGLLTRYRFYAGWSAQSDETQGIRPDRVALRFDKPVYTEGETVKLTVTPPHAGEALITLEGDKLLWKKRLHVGIDGATVDIPLNKEWKRHDLYVSAMVLRPGVAGKTDGAKIAKGVTPARALGLAHLPLDREARQFKVALEAPQKMEPEQPLKVKVKVPGAGGGKTLVTLSAVDVGILNITRFASPDPFGFYFGKLRYSHDLYDIYGRLIEKMDGQKGKLKWGGDASTAKQTKDLPKKVRLVDLFSGPVELDANGEAEIALNVPDFNGALRLMAVVADKDRYGMREAEVVIAAPLIVELNTPRFLSVGDSALLALDVQNLAGSPQNISIDVSNDAGLKIQNGTQKLTLKDQEKKILRIPLEAGDAIGLTEVRVKVDSPRKKFSRTFPLQVQAPTPLQTATRYYIVNPGETQEIREADLNGFLRRTVAGTLAVSSKPPIDVRSAVHGLLRYPYGCVEQTTSTTYPHVLIGEDDAKRFGLKAFSLEQRAAMIDKSIGRLASMQSPNGGFSLWGNAEYQYWLSAYVAHFLLDARENGFTVPEEMEKKTVEFLLKNLQEGIAGLPRGPVAYRESSVWNDIRYAGSGRFGVLAYGAYVLARQGKAPLSTLRQIFESKDAAHSGLALVHLGLALHLTGDENRAKEAIQAGIVKARTNDQWWWGDYGSDVRDRAQSYVLLKKHGLKPEGRENLILQVADGLKQKRYLSTQERLAIFMMGREIDATDARDAETWSAEIIRKGKAEKVEKVEKISDRYLPVDADELASGLRFRNTHSERLYVQLNYSGHPEKMPPAKNNPIRLERRWYHADGSPLNARPLRVGETLLIRVEIKASHSIANLLVADYVPAGVEIENANIVQGAEGRLQIDRIDVEQAMRDSSIKHREFRDDRFVASLRLRGTANLFYRVRVVTPGKFVVPPVYAEDMYQPAINGQTSGGETLTIVDGVER